MNITDIFAQSITSRPEVIQFSKDRKYEEAWIINRSDELPSDNQIREYLSEAFTVLIAEFIWHADDDANRFVLTLFLDKQCVLRDPYQFVTICLALFYRYPGFLEFIHELDRQIVGRDYLLRYPIEGVDIGVFNHWMSVGPLTLWTPGEQYRKDEVERRILSRPEITESSLNYQGLLFRFNVSRKYSGPYYGIKTPCCVKNGPVWKVDFTMADFWMSQLLE